ncbi:MAG: hypothetical protein LQ342_006690 [Letrouitia transgressa]|nr:MAG: hypothetical protein LQ342_006690 [Letrouitia transgressa]
MYSLLLLLSSSPLALSFPFYPPQLRLQVPNAASSSPSSSSSSNNHNDKNNVEPILPTCESSTFTQPCQCPEGTKYESTVTYAVIGANAHDVRAVTGNFFDIRWLGMEPLVTEGPENTKGSTRTDWVPTMKGHYNFTEEALEYKFHPDGGFETAYKQQNVPIVYHADQGPGSFAGELVTWKSEYLGEHETAVQWGVYVCFTGGLLGFPEFHEMGLNNASKILEAQGKLKGKNVKPWSTAHSLPPEERKMFEL